MCLIDGRWPGSPTLRTVTLRCRCVDRSKQAASIFSLRTVPVEDLLKQNNVGVYVLICLLWHVLPGLCLYHPLPCIICYVMAGSVEALPRGACRGGHSLRMDRRVVHQCERVERMETMSDGQMNNHVILFFLSCMARSYGSK